MNKRRIFRKAVFYLVGQLILALGISLAVRSDLGVSPVSSLPLVCSRIFNIEMGNMTMIIHFVFVFMQFVLLGKDFSLANFLQVPVAILFGKLVTLTNMAVSPIVLKTLATRYLVMIMSVILISLGVKLYMWADVCPQAPEGLVKAVSDRFGLPFAAVKNGFDISCVILAAILSLIFLRSLSGIREGTVIAALLVGRMAGIWEKFFGKKASAFLQA